MSKPIKIILTVMLLLYTVILFIYDYGIVKYIEVKSEQDSLRQVYDMRSNAIKLLKDEIDSVKARVPFKMESLAREKYQMSKSNERVIVLKEVE